jgi:hypothetical protein
VSFSSPLAFGKKEAAELFEGLFHYLRVELGAYPNRMGHREAFLLNLSGTNTLAYARASVTKKKVFMPFMSS